MTLVTEVQKLIHIDFGILSQIISSNTHRCQCYNLYIAVNIATIMPGVLSIVIETALQNYCNRHDISCDI